jgi:hypothetical protein
MQNLEVQRLGDREARRPTSPESVAAAINAAIVVVLPLILLSVPFLLHNPETDTSVTIRPPGASVIGPVIMTLGWIVSSTLPFATIAAWRTWVYATRWQDEKRGSWLAVLEAGAWGLAVALLVLAPGIVTRPMDAPPYVIAYGGFALLVGLVLGLILRTAALLVLRFHPGSR